MDCFHDGEQMLYIDPDRCIDCGACVSECPVDAIYHEDHLPAELRPYRDLNVTMARQSPVVVRRPKGVLGRFMGIGSD
jgi:ferredoxin